MYCPSQPLNVFPSPSDFCSPITRVMREGTYGFYGPLSISRLANSACDFILKHCTADRDGVVQAVSSLLANSAAHVRQHASSPHRESSTHSTWLCVRITGPSDEWITPRWHRDGRMFHCKCAAPRPHAKYAVTLLGPPTRILCQSDGVDAVLRKVEAQNSSMDEERAELASALESMPLVELRAGQIVRFTWGEDDAPVHSEPDSSAEDRLFVSVMFGSEEELRDMCSVRDEVYGEESIWTSPRSLG